MSENFVRIIAVSIALIIGFFSYRTKQLDCVKNAFVFRLCYALTVVQGVLFFAVDILHLF